MKEIKRMQELAGINEIKVNNPLSYFKQWKKEVTDHISHFQDEDMWELVDLNKFNLISDPEEAIEYLVDTEYLEDNEDDRENSRYFIKNGEFMTDKEENNEYEE